ncbi:MFS transporter [Alisedimentitalea sp. MJ-SS2]|uniref:MFS transporter n=1 Tax=Aliisedimentitalea sp. MJ-SS2 TaxID=3049795 RepID=UPI00290D0C62|nr:MFS transporter [Alisedimentitalea sp. MJ-SS2]MDU8927440.1 MFS transporter [Alisedimentitalea sp. MJ-SS2]
MSVTGRISRQQVVVLAVCVAIFALGQFHRASGSVFTPILMQRFALPAATIGGLVSAMFLATIVAQLPFGALLDRSGPRRLLALCMAIVSVGTVVFALAGGFGAAVVSRVLIGIGLASMGAATHVIIARNFAPRDFGYFSGLVVTLGGVGGLMGTYPLALALERVAWPVVFGTVAALTAVLAVLIFRAVPHVPKPEGDAEEEVGGYLSLLRQKEFLKVLALGVVTFAPITTITGLWGGPYLQQVAGMSPEGAGAVLLLLFVATIAGGVSFGMLDRRAKSRKRVILVSAGLSAASLLVLALLERPGVVVTVALLLAMVFFQHFYVPLGAHMRRLVPDHMLGRGSTLLTLFAVAMIPVMQVGFGMILDWAEVMGWDLQDRYRLAFAAIGGMIVLSTVVYSTVRTADDDVV